MATLVESMSQYISRISIAFLPPALCKQVADEIDSGRHMMWPEGNASQQAAFPILQHRPSASPSVKLQSARVEMHLDIIATATSECWCSNAGSLRRKGVCCLKISY